MNQDLSNLDRRDRGMTPEYYGAADPHGYVTFGLILGRISAGVAIVAALTGVVLLICQAVAS